ncbi:MAG TPA: metallophosphoesterase family protein [Azospirillaceae bacterium]|nr:metallophosphoesterase family protein [Azospirillaceae bacterium]
MPAAARIPAGQRIYAVGDVHGCDALLRDLFAAIAADAASAPEGTLCTIVMLGDYVDRGPASAAVLDRLSAGPPPGLGMVCLRGNHDDVMLRFLEDPEVGFDWLRFGGLATLDSYGVRPTDALPMHEKLAAARRDLSARLPARHRAFLRDLRLSLVVGDYLFVHAGIKPGVPLAEQKREHLLWIRDEFLGSRADHGKVVVHGHTVVREPEVRPNRIGIDTGAFATGRLTALVLEADTRRFLTT